VAADAVCVLPSSLVSNNPHSTHTPHTHPPPPQLAKRLFDVDVIPADGDAPVWHPDARFFKLAGPDGAPRAYFYLDPYSRPAEKRGGAWMAEVVGRSGLFAPEGAAARLPVAHMVCNQMVPIGDKPSLMTFREVGGLAAAGGGGFRRGRQLLYRLVTASC
jgi:hypothetical protein